MVADYWLVGCDAFLHALGIVLHVRVFVVDALVLDVIVAVEVFVLLFLCLMLLFSIFSSFVFILFLLLRFTFIFFMCVL